MPFPRTINSEPESVSNGETPGSSPAELENQAPEEGTEGLPPEKQIPLMNRHELETRNRPAGADDPAQGKGIIPPYVERGTDMGVEF